MRNHAFKILFIVLIVTNVGCASKKYAELYVVTTGRSADVYSACDGQYLGMTPLTYNFEKTEIGHDPLVFPILLVRDGYKPVHKVALINKWVDNKQDTVLLENRNTMSIEMTAACECVRD